MVATFLTVVDRYGKEMPKPLLVPLSAPLVAAPLLTPLLASAALLRLVLLLYGIWHDAHSALKYTDVDYYVFTDAARSVWNGKSPYDRETYRYTPFLACLLVPNVILHPAFGKVLFSLADLGIGYLLWQILINQNVSAKRTAYLVAITWLLNPLVATISTRGNAESLVGLLVLASLYAIQKQDYIRGAICLGLAVHLKVYPIIYSISIVAHLFKSKFRSLVHFSVVCFGTFMLLNLAAYSMQVSHYFLIVIPKKNETAGARNLFSTPFSTTCIV